MIDTVEPATGNDADLATAAAQHALCIGAVLHRTDKSVVARGTWQGQAVIIKMITTDDPYWRARRAHELAVHRLFRTTPPPLPVAHLLLHDERVAVYTAVPGTRLHDGRHLTTDVPAQTAIAVLDALDAVSRWTAMTEPEPDYRARIDLEPLSEADRAVLHRLLDGLGSARRLAHGDPIPANVLLDGERCHLVDWEFSGRYLPGYDLAVLHTVGAAASPTLAAAIETRVAAAGITAAYLVNLGLLLSRETRIHMSLPDGPQRRQRLAVVERLRAGWRQRLPESLQAAGG